LLVPPFHGRRLAAYESTIEDEAVKEMATWPEGREFATLDSMMRITLNVILRAVFGAEGAELQELRNLLPTFVKYGSRLAVLPIRRGAYGRLNPWVRFDRYRRHYDDLVTRLIDKAEADPQLERRDDILAMMLQARYDDGSRMTRSQIADQLLTLLTAGHETTATTLAWAVERLRRHPDVVRRLVEEVDAGGSELREATIWEVQRVRPVIDVTGRQVRAETMRLGKWTLPRGQMVIASLFLVHDNDDLWPNPRRFDPDRFVGERPDNYRWIPFGGGARRCIGAAFAHLEMNVVLRTLFRDFGLESTDAPDERWHSRGVAYAPAKGGRAVVHRRRAGRRAAPVVESAEVSA
jgi:cytochrome P450